MLAAHIFTYGSAWERDRSRTICVGPVSGIRLTATSIGFTLQWSRLMYLRAGQASLLAPQMNRLNRHRTGHDYCSVQLLGY